MKGVRMLNKTSMTEVYTGEHNLPFGCNPEMSVIIPGLQWYLDQSAFKNISPRCQFATVQSCPRFYQSLSLLGNAGSTKIPQKEDKKLLKNGKSHHFGQQQKNKQLRYQAMRTIIFGTFVLKFHLRGSVFLLPTWIDMQMKLIRISHILSCQKER